MDPGDGGSLALLAVAAYLATSALARLMKGRYDALLARLRRNWQEERNRRIEEEHRQRREARKRRQHHPTQKSGESAPDQAA